MAKKKKDLPAKTVAEAPGRDAVADTLAAPVAADAAELPAGDGGRYRTQEELGRGGLGRVLRAHDQRLDRVVAIKEAVSRDGPIAARFAREALITARLQHPSIVPIYDAGTWPDGSSFYAMKLVTGRPLSKLIEERRPLDERLALIPNVIAVADAIAYAHSCRIIHRDLKPDNVLVGEFGETVVIDWGIAKDLSTDDNDDGPLLGSPYRLASQEMTVAGAVIGTPAYMAPEQAAGKLVDERADVYAIGGLLYHVLSGAPPFRGDSAEDVLTQVVARAPAPLDRRSGVPPDLATIVRKAMARAPEDRYPTARELAEDLKRFQAGQLVSARRYSFWAILARWLHRHRLPVGIALAALLVVASLGVFAVRRVIRERNAASRAEAAAEAKANELILVHARSVLDRDPTASIAWLKQYSPRAPGWAEAQRIAADAASRGVALHVLPVERTFGVVFSADGATVVSADEHALWVWDAATGRVLRTVELGGSPPSIAVAGDGRAILPVDARVRLVQPDGTVVDAIHHDRAVFVALFSPDGSSIASADTGGVVRVLGADGVARELGSAQGEIAQLVFSPDGRQLASATAGGLVHVLPIDGAAPMILHGPDGAATSVAFSPDGRRLASGAADGTVRVWALDTAAPAAVLAGHPEPVKAVAFLADGSLLSRDAHVVRLWDLATGTSRVVDSDPNGVVALATVGDAVATAHADGRIRVVDVVTSAERTLTGHAGAASSLAFAPSGFLLVSASEDATIRVWSLAPTHERVFRANAAVQRVAFMPDDRALATGQVDGSIRIWDRTTGAATVLGGGSEAITLLEVAADGARVLSITGDGIGRVGSLDGTPPRTLAVPGTTCNAALFLDRDRVLTGGGDGALRIWDLAQPDLAPHVLTGHEASVDALALDAAGRVVSGDSAGAVRVWDLAAGTSRQIGQAGGAIKQVAVVEGGRVVVAMTPALVAEWRVDTGEMRALLETADTLRRMAIAPDDGAVAVCGDDPAVRVVERATGTVRELVGQAAGGRWLGFSPDGAWLASAGRDGTVRAWSPASGVGLIVHRHLQMVRGVAWSSDGRWIASASSDGTAWIGAIADDELLPSDAGDLARAFDRLTTAAIGASSLPRTP